MKNWIKGGLWGVGIALLLSLIIWAIIASQGESVRLPSTLHGLKLATSIYSIPGLIIVAVAMFLSFGYEQPNVGYLDFVLGVIISILIYFVIGALVSLLVRKIRSK